MIVGVGRVLIHLFDLEFPEAASGRIASRRITCPFNSSCSHEWAATLLLKRVLPGIGVIVLHCILLSLLLSNFFKESDPLSVFRVIEPTVIKLPSYFVNSSED